MKHKEIADLLISDLRHRKKIRDFYINGRDDLCSATLKLIEDIVEELKQIESTYEEVSFTLHNDKKDNFELCITWINPADKKDQTVVIVLYFPDNNLLRAKLDLALYNEKIYSIIEYNAKKANHSHQVHMESYKPILNGSDEVCWKGKEETLSSDEITYRVVEIVLTNYDKA